MTPPSRAWSGRVYFIAAGVVHVTHAEHYRSLFHSWPEPVWLLSTVRNDGRSVDDFTVEYANPASCSLLGPQVENPEGRRLRELLSPETFRDFAERLRPTVESSTPPADPVIAWLSGSPPDPIPPRLFEIRASKTDDGVLSIWREASGHHKASGRSGGESFLGRDEAKYRTIFELAGLSLWEEDISELRAHLAELKKEGISDLGSYFETHPELLNSAASMIRVVDVNDTTLRLYGANSKDELLGPISTALILSDPVARKSLVDNILAIAEGTTYTQRESLVMTPEGKRLNILINAYIPDANDDYPHMLVGIVDITERKRAEERIRDLARLAEESPNPVLRVSLDGAVTYANRAAWPVAVAITGADGAKVLAEYMSLFSRASEHAEKLGTEIVVGGRTYNFSIVPIPNGEYINLYGRDVTDEKSFAEGLMRSQKMEAVGRLAGGVAHDFNNILTTIQGCCELIRDELPSDTPAFRYATEVRLAAERAATLTRQLLAFSRGQVYQPRVVDLNEILRRVERMLSRLIGEHIALIPTLADNLWPIWVDPSHVEQIAMSLAVNARDAMPRGGRLYIETTNVVLVAEQAREHPGTAPGEYVMVTVRDTGVGMDRETMSRLFEPFFTTKEAGRGTGLGLATVREIVKQSLGSISVSSEKGKGTTITLYFPRADRQRESSPAVP